MEMTLRTFSVLVDDEPGVLSQISRLFSRKGFNIESLAVGPTEERGLSRLTLEVLTDDQQTELLCNQLSKMVPVHSVRLLAEEHSIRREMVLCKVRAEERSVRSELIQLANVFRGLHSGRFLHLHDPGGHRGGIQKRGVDGSAPGVRDSGNGPHRHGGAGAGPVHHSGRAEGNTGIQSWKNAVNRAFIIYFNTKPL